MNPHPGFTVRLYATFGMARMYRVLVSPDALYFLRTGGFISPSDAGSGFQVDPGGLAMSAVLRWFGRRTLNSARIAFESTDPEELVRSSKRHFKLGVDDLVTSSLEPPSLLSGHGHYYASWKVVTPKAKMRFQIEDPDSLETALEHLPPLLGEKLTVKVERPHGGDRARSRLLG